MPKLFTLAQRVLEKLLDDWYAAQTQFTEQADGVFSEKGKQYDRLSPVWERIQFPHGFIQEIRKKVDRLLQLLADYDPTQPWPCGVNWGYEGGVLEELIDIFNYSRMMAGIIIMKALEARGGRND
ncbi:MAG: hypothetical protein GTO63_04030 [Anaerolineae bacterium]|nr:hypothetical protein [Anaerolineae bacterium]NIQ77229.1 hypothetical protein [Anaerolineae bacterium]